MDDHGSPEKNSEQRKKIATEESSKRIRRLKFTTMSRKMFRYERGVNRRPKKNAKCEIGDTPKRQQNWIYPARSMSKIMAKQVMLGTEMQVPVSHKKRLGGLDSNEDNDMRHCGLHSSVLDSTRNPVWKIVRRKKKI